MAVDHLLAVVPVSDIDAAGTWYESLIGRRADNNPMPTLVEWQLVDSGWLQVFVDADRTGSGLLNFAVNNLEHHIAELRHRGLRPSEIVDANSRAKAAAIGMDGFGPDANRFGKPTTLAKWLAEDAAAWRPGFATTWRRRRRRFSCQPRWYWPSGRWPGR